jgi:hypothetical protein
LKRSKSISSNLQKAVTPLPTDLAAALDKLLSTFRREEGALFAQMRDSLAEVSGSLAKAAESIAARAQSQSTGAQIGRFTDVSDATRSVGEAGSSKVGSVVSPTKELLVKDVQAPLGHTEKPHAAQVAAPHSDGQEDRSSFPMQRDEPNDSSRHFPPGGTPTVDTKTVEVRESFGGTRPELPGENEGKSPQAAHDTSRKSDDANAGSGGTEVRSSKVNEPARRGLFTWLRGAPR